MGRLSSVVLLAGIGLAACATEDPGISPGREALYFPTGLALDPAPDWPFLYVTNSNADLKYNGGTITVLDLRRLPERVDELRARIGEGRLDCQVDRQDNTSWECPAGQFLISGATLRIGNYPADIQLRQTARGRQLFVPVRGQNYLLWTEVVEVDGPGGERSVDLRCNFEPEKGCTRGTRTDCPVWDCDGAHLVKASEDGRRLLPEEPYGMVLNQLAAVHVGLDGVRRTCRDGVSAGLSCACEAGQRPCAVDAPDRDCCIAPPATSHLYLSHLSGGEVSFLVAEDESVVLRDIKGGFFTASGEIRGAFSLSARTPGDAESLIYVSSRVDTVLASFTVRHNTQIVDVGRMPLAAIQPPPNERGDLRGIAFSPGGERLYAVSRQPPALVAFDMRPEDDGQLKGEPLWVAEVCSEPSILRLIQDPTRPTDPMAQLAYVVCFGSAQIFVVDTTLGRVVDQIMTGKGPNSLVIDEPHRRAFIANFLENTVGLVDLDPAHSSYHRMVLRIGVVENLIRQ